MSGSPPYDHKREIAAKGGKVVELWASEDEWAFEVEGALALQPEVSDGLKDPPRFVSVPRMVESQAQGIVAARALQREQIRARARRSRRTAALLVVALVSLVTLLLNQSRVTAIGYHASGTTTLPLQPVGSQANAGLFGRIVQRLFGQSGSGIRYYLIGGGVGPQTGGLDIGAPVRTDVYAPVDGTVIAISDQVVNGRAYGVRIDIQPSGDPDVVVALTNLRPDPALTVGSTVSSGRTKIGRLIDLSSVEQAALAEYTHDKGQHVHIEVHAASALATP